MHFATHTHKKSLENFTILKEETSPNSHYEKERFSDVRRSGMIDDSFNSLKNRRIKRNKKPAKATFDVRGGGFLDPGGKTNI
jgi:hypothetical protein